MNEHSDNEDANGDGEGVWSPDIEQCFREALLLFPPCGRRKHILQEEGGGKMYGRNELIARHIKMRTGKERTRKQVSSHIQVLARRKAKAESSTGGDSVSPAGSMGMGVGGTGGGGANFARVAAAPDAISSEALQHHRLAAELSSSQQHQHQQQQPVSYYDVWLDRPIVTQRIRLVEFSAFIEYRQTTSVQQPVFVQAANHQAIAPAGGLTTLLVGGGSSTTPTTTIGNVAEAGELLPLNNGNNLSAPTPLQVSTPPFYVNPTTVASGAVGSAAATILPIQSAANPLASNHLLPAQFNQANNYNQQLPPNQPLNNNTHYQHHMKKEQGVDLLTTSTSTNNSNNGIQLQLQQQQLQSSTGFTRHSYVKIDCRQAPGGQTRDKLERIDISQIQDKFPEIGGPDGLFQRGPPDAFYLVKFWADLNNDYEYNIEDQNSYFGFSSHFETIDPYKDITCSTKACSYGLQVVEKVEKIYGAFNSLNGRYSYDINRSPMCEFMIQFIKKLRQLPRASQMNSVLENFTVLQLVTCESSSEILLCLAYVFEIASPEQNQGSQYHVYKLTRD